MLKSSWFPRVQWQIFQIQQLCIHTQCSVILACHWWYKLFVHWWMEGIYFASFYFRVWDLTREIRKNKNPAKISTYTVRYMLFLGRYCMLQFVNCQQGRIVSNNFWVIWHFPCDSPSPHIPSCLLTVWRRAFWKLPGRQSSHKLSLHMWQSHL